MDAVIHADGLVKTFGQVRAVDGLSLRVAAGEIYGLVGADGAGKTTTLRLLVGALRPDAGTAVIAGLDLRAQVEQARARIGYLSQRFSLYEDLSVLENIRFFAEVRGLRASEWRPRCDQILQFVGLDAFADRRAGLLSGGMKQKLGLASALVHRPQVLLLDEPTTGVDPVTRQDFWQLLIRLQASEGIAVLISTPYMDEASRCTRVGFLRNGRVLREGTPSQLRELLTGRVLELRGGPLQALRAAAFADADVQDVRAFGDRLHLRVASGTGAAVVRRLPGAARRAGASVDSLRVVAPTLEDTFIALAEETDAGQA